MTNPPSEGSQAVVSGKSRLWDSLSSTLFSKIDDDFVSSFRRPGGANGRLASWDPYDRTMRYYKFLLFGAAQRQPEEFFHLYKRLGSVDIGNPVSVTARGCKINIDYLFSVEEFLFLAGNMDVASLRSVVEVGAGFGRTCQALLALLPSIERYTIVDLKNMIELSRRVLQKALPAQFHKVMFLDADNVEQWNGLKADLAINIDSFQEMPPATIDGYMKGIVGGCRHFYTKNPIGKYRPETIGLVAEAAVFQDVFSLGYCRDLIDIFDDEDLEAARSAYVKAYRPPRGILLADRPVDLFHYLHHALYQV